MASTSTERENPIEQFASDCETIPATRHDIFINHRGSDVKSTFAMTIYHALHGMRLHVFLDVEALEPGVAFPKELRYAISTAALHIAIFSPNYAQSPWCLAELCLMLKTGAKIIPIFYHVKPTDLKLIKEGKGLYAEAFSKHKKDCRYKPEMLDDWRKALFDISFHHGYLINDDKDEPMVVKKIVEYALKTLSRAPFWNEHPVGLDKLVGDYESVAGEEAMQITGIVGMAGSGKTTLAKELYNRISSSFELCSFVSSEQEKALIDKQRKLLADLGVRHLPFDNLDGGTAVLARRLRYLRALIVLDAVDHIDHLNALLPDKNNLRYESVVIVTTRDSGVRRSWGLSCIYKMPRLNRLYAEQLFCWHAFSQPFPPTKFKYLVERIVNTCNGLPLSLKVLGQQLSSSTSDSTEYWESYLTGISRTLPEKIKKILRCSYDELGDEDKEMFLDVACFLNGERKSVAITVWDASGWNGLLGLVSLVNRSLVELVCESDYSGESFSHGDKIRMHDHLIVMGREIASNHSLYRFCYPGQRFNLQENSKIRGIRPADAFVAFKEYRHHSVVNPSRRSKRLRFSTELKILSVKGNEFTEEFAPLSKHLVWLRWEGFPHRNLPSWLTLGGLHVLELHDADELEELWEDNADPPLQLRELLIFGGNKLHRLPSSIGRLKHLKKIQFYFHGRSLSEEFLALANHTMLSSLPAGFGNFISLRNINFGLCGQLCEIPEIFTQLTHLEELNLSGCKMLSSLPPDFGNLRSLRNMNLGGCLQLSTLPDSLKLLTRLEELNLSGCQTLSSLPESFGNLVSLRKINLKSCIRLSTLPDSFKQLIRLEDLDLSGCNELVSLQDHFGDLIYLQNINLKSCIQLSKFPNCFKLHIHLKYLNLSGCQILSSLPAGFGNLITLQNIDLASCKHLRTLPDSFKQLIHLKELNLSGCRMLESLPADFGNLRSLQNLNLESCIRLKTLPGSFKQMIHLVNLNLSRCEKLKRLDMLENIKKLKSLNLSYCKGLKDLPHQIMNQGSLTKLHLQGCIKLGDVPTEIGDLGKLHLLTIGTRMWKSLQNSLVNLSSLKSIEIENSESEMGFDAGATSSLRTFKEVDMEDGKQFSRISICSYCCPNLGSLMVGRNNHLTALETLPVSLKALSVNNCEVLKNVRCFSGLVKLEKLKICHCPQLEELPSISGLVSLKEFEITNCSKVEKIEGLEHSKSLKTLRAKTCWKAPGIPSLEKVEGLKLLHLKCDTISALKPCIQFMKEFPRLMRIEGSAICFEKITVNPLEFPDLSVWEVEEPCGVDRIPDSFNSAAFLCYVEEKGENEEERKVVHVCVSLENYLGKSEALNFFNGKCKSDGSFQDNKAMVVMGKEERVVEFFYKLFGLLE